MALQVITNPTTQKISGVVQANPGTISGVTSAAPGTISGVSASPVGTGAYNPQQPVSLPGTANPQGNTFTPQGTSPVLQPAIQDNDIASREAANAAIFQQNPQIFGVQTAGPNFDGLKQGFVNVTQSGQQAPNTQGEATTAILDNTPYADPRAFNAEQQLAADPGYQTLLATRNQYNSYANQGQSLMDFYNQSVKDAGIPAINQDLLNYKRIIEGTEDDIRNEVSAVGGFATESQVLALTGARNKALIKNYNNLLATKEMAMEQINNMVNLAGQDREFAMQAAMNRFNIDKQILEYRDKFINNAQEGYNKIIGAVGYQGLYASLKNDPKAVALVERTLGLQPGQLAALGGYQKPLSPEEQADLALKQAQTLKILNELGGDDNKQLSIDDLKKLKDMGYNVSPNMTYGEVRNVLGATTGGNATSEQRTKSKAEIDLIGELFNDPSLKISVGPNAFTRVNTDSWRAFLYPGTKNFVAGVEQLVKTLTTRNLTDLKKDGATFGSLSDAEWKIVGDAATKINTWAIVKNGKTVGYDVNQSDFINELDKIYAHAKLDYVRKGGAPEEVGMFYDNQKKVWVSPTSNGEEGYEFTDRELMLQGFNQAGKPQASTGSDLQLRNLSFGLDASRLNVKIGAGAAVKNNNPGNLRDSDGSWMKFSTPQEGFSALTGYVERAKTGDHPRYNGNLSLYQFFSIYAPSADNNNPKAYAENVAQRLGVNPNTKIKDVNTFAFAREIARHESSTVII